MKNILFFGGLFLLLGCSNEELSKNDSYVNNMECIDCWRNSNTLTKEIAHSGLYSSKLDSASEYSVTFEIPVKNMNAKSLKKAIIKLWVYFPEPGVTGKIAAQATLNGETKFWMGYNLEDQVKNAKEWTAVAYSITLPPNIKNMDNFGVYVMNPAKNKFFVDDFDISFE